MSWQYIAGFFEGEGSITQNGKGYRITIAQTNLGVLKAIQRFSQMGHIITVTKRQPHWKDSWVYYISKQREIQQFLQSLFPLLIVKKSLASTVMRKLEHIVIHQQKKARLAQHRKDRAKLLRRRGLSYRAIGNELGIDFGYARRIILGLHK